MGQGKSQFSEEELQDYQVYQIITKLNMLLNIFYVCIIGSDIFYKERSIIVS